MTTKQETQPHKKVMPSLIIVDDEEAILRSFKSLFRRDGYNMNFFTSGYEALAFLEKNEVDVIISDMRMPEINGAELLSRSLKTNPNAIRIIVSGYEEKSIILDALSEGLAKHYVMKPWEDNELRILISDVMKLQQEWREQKLQKLLNSLRNLPSPPRWHVRLMNILNEGQHPQKEIANEIEKSPELVAKLLRVSNSVFYGLRRSITTIYEALTFIGTEAVLNIVLAIESFDNLSVETTPEMENKLQVLRNIAVKRAHVARELALNWKEKIDEHEAYVAGLLLDIGLILRFYSSKNDFSEFQNKYNELKESHYIVDKAIHDLTHDQVGAALLTYWNFPKSIIAAVANHHSFANNDPLITITQIANFLVQPKDSYPLDDTIEALAKEWKSKVQSILEKEVESEFN
jgi:HD-like signal output (HDOD) protein